MRKGVLLGLLLGLAVNAAAQAWGYHGYQAVFHQGDSTAAGYWAGFWRQFSWIKFVCSGLLFMVLGELAQQKAEQRALVRELEAELRARHGGEPPAGDEGGWVTKVFRKFNF